jgi:hypothetical protein
MSFWAWINRKGNRESLAFWGGGAVVVIGALWTAFVHFYPDVAPTLTIEAKYVVCVGNEELCPVNSVVLNDGSSVADWAVKECSKYEVGVTKELCPNCVQRTFATGIECNTRR